MYQVFGLFLSPQRASADQAPSGFSFFRDFTLTSPVRGSKVSKLYCSGIPRSRALKCRIPSRMQALFHQATTTHHRASRHAPQESESVSRSRHPKERAYCRWCQCPSPASRHSATSQRIERFLDAQASSNIAALHIPKTNRSISGRRRQNAPVGRQGHPEYIRMCVPQRVAELQCWMGAICHPRDQLVLRLFPSLGHFTPYKPVRAESELWSRPSLNKAEPSRTSAVIAG